MENGWTVEKYMANCITRIYRAPCSIHRLHDRDQDIVEAMVIASTQNLEAAHQYLVKLCTAAEAGVYASQPSAQRKTDDVQHGVDCSCVQCQADAVIRKVSGGAI